MELVGPLREQSHIDAVKGVLLHRADLRDYCLFVVGINCWLSADALLELRMADVVDSHGHVRDKIHSATYGAYADVCLADTAKQALQRYLRDRFYYTLDEPVFRSEKGGGMRAIHRAQAWKVLHHAGKAAGIKQSVGLNTLRKTWGYHALQRGVSVARLKELFHHRSLAFTLSYLEVYENSDPSHDDKELVLNL